MVHQEAAGAIISLAEAGEFSNTLAKDK